MAHEWDSICPGTRYAAKHNWPRPFIEPSGTPSMVSLLHEPKLCEQVQGGTDALLRIGEKLLEWTDTDPSLDTILTKVSLYWFTQCLPSSLYPYRQLFGARAQRFGTPNTEFKYFDKPTGFSFFPYELSPGIKEVLEKSCNLVSYRQHEHGGHFAALEQPEELWGDVEEYARIAWKV